MKGLLYFKNDWRNETVSNLKVVIRIVGVQLVHTHVYMHACMHKD